MDALILSLPKNVLICEVIFREQKQMVRYGY